MTTEEFIELLNDLRPNISKEINKSYVLEEIGDWNYVISNVKNYDYRYYVEKLNNCLSHKVRIDNFLIYNDYIFDDSFEEDGFYPFGFYVQDYLFINLKTNRIEARDYVLTKYYDVAKNEEAFLEAFLVFAKHYAYSLENPMEQPDYYSLYLSISLDQRREILKGVLKIVGGKKYRPFWVQVFQGWTNDELKEMGE